MRVARNRPCGSTEPGRGSLNQGVHMVGISLERKGIQVTWDSSLSTEKEAVLYFSRNGDVSNTDARANDGNALVSVPYTFEGTTHLEVKDLNGNTIDEGDLTI